MFTGIDGAHGAGADATCDDVLAVGQRVARGQLDSQVVVFTHQARVVSKAGTSWVGISDWSPPRLVTLELRRSRSCGQPHRVPRARPFRAVSSELPSWGGCLVGQIVYARISAIHRHDGLAALCSASVAHRLASLEEGSPTPPPTPGNGLRGERSLPRPTTRPMTETIRHFLRQRVPRSLTLSSRGRWTRQRRLIRPTSITALTAQARCHGRRM